MNASAAPAIPAAADALHAPRVLLVELLAEELPPKALRALGEAFGAALHAGLKARQLVGDRSTAMVHASPRRLAVQLTDVLPLAPARAVSHKLMPVSVGMDASGAATPALARKLAALGAADVPVASLARRVDGKTEALFLEQTQPGATLAAGLQEALDAAIASLPIPKVMQYQLADGWQTVQFVRPVHGLVALHGADVVPVRAFGLQAGRQTRGHRFEARVDPVVLQDARHYGEQMLEQGRVVTRFEARRARIAEQLRERAQREGLVPVDDAALLDEVTALVEWPNVLVARFEDAFLDVPAECLVLTMKANQKYFPLLDASGKLTSRFLVVANVEPADPSRIVQGNERVVRPRLADAKFFYDQDRKRRLAARVDGLDKVVYHGKLGTQGQRMRRVRAAARAIGALLGSEATAQQAYDAATLAKADLLTDMVGEFPELQGTMGAYYARHDGAPAAVAEAIEDHYKPRFAGDALPRNAVGTAVALADKLETLVGLFGIGQVPTGDKDPFALRRHALGVARILIEGRLPVSLPALIDVVQRQFDGGPPIADVREAVRGFVYERIAGWLRERGATAQEVDAVLALRPERLDVIEPRLAALRAFAALPEAQALAAANKRVGNILRKSDGDGGDAVGAGGAADPARFTLDAERALHAAIATATGHADAALARGDDQGSLTALAALKQPVDAFFDGVMVNDPDVALRANRLALLRSLHGAMNRIADLSRLAAG